MATVPFTPRTFAEILAGMISHARATNLEITDYNIGSVTRTLLEASAVELDELYQTLYAALVEAIPIAIYEGFSFTALPAQAARGVVTFTLDEVQLATTTIAARTPLRNPATTILYETQTELVIAAGELTGSVLIAATTTGANTNTAAGTITAYWPTLLGLTVTNAEAISGGADDETAEERRVRFIRYIQSLARGTVASLQAAAMNAVIYSLGGLPMERVLQAAVTETAGHVIVYIHNGTGNTSDDLTAAAARLIEGYYNEDTGQWIAGYRPAGMAVVVEVMTEVPLNVSVEIETTIPDGDAALTQSVKDVLTATILGPRARPTLRPIDLINAVLLVSGVDGCTILTPTVSVPIDSSDILIPGILTVTWAS